MKRKVIDIDHEKCTGCGLCIPNCPEGAIQMIDGKARLVSDLFCDGLGACLGHCPEGAISIEEREAEPYSERLVMENIVKQGPNVIKAHLDHLRDHGETAYLDQAIGVLSEKGTEVSTEPAAEEQLMEKPCGGGCPGSRTLSFGSDASEGSEAGARQSRLTHWPIQMHLVSPMAQHYRGADLLLAADCVAFSMGDFHKDHLKGRALAIACPKLDEGQEVYVEKLVAFIDEAKVNTITVMMMQVPCCGGLLRMVNQAAARANRKVPVKALIVSLKGEVLSEEWV